MTNDAIQPDDLDALIRAHGGLEGLARELGQHPPTFIGEKDKTDDNEPRERVGLWRWLLNQLGAALASTR